MSLTRRAFNRLLLAGPFLALYQGTAQAANLVEGRDYERIQPPQANGTPGRIQVLEFFSYGCPHCKDFHPLVKAWVEKLPRDVEFQRVPVTFGRTAWANLARLFYSLEAMGELSRLDDAVFRAIHDERVHLFTPEAITAWVQRMGVDGQRFRTVFESFGVGARVARSEQMERQYRVRSVPRLTVAGRYVVTGQAARSQAELLTITDGLIDMVRQGNRTGRS